LLALGALAAIVAAGCESPQPWRIEVASVDPNGVALGNGGVVEPDAVEALPSFSADGSVVAFASGATNLVTGVQPTPGGLPQGPDVYVRALGTGPTRMASVVPGGAVSASGSSHNPALSPDGRRVAFESDSTDLLPGTGGIERQVYLRDLSAGTTSVISVKAAGTGGGNAASRAPVFSPDGTRVLFESSASDLGPTDTNGFNDLYLRDLDAGTTSLVSVNPAGTDSVRFGLGLGFTRPVFSPDGSMVAFASWTTDFVGGGGNPLPRLYVRDLASGVTTLIAPLTSALVNTGGSMAFSADGSQLVFTSDVDLVPGQPGGGRKQIYLYDLATATTRLVSAGPSGVAGDGDSASPALSPNAGHVVFESQAANLGPADANGQADVFRADLATGEVTLVTLNAAGTGAADHGGDQPAVSPDGRRIAFRSGSTDLGPTAASAGIYVRDLATGTTSRVSAAGTGRDVNDAGDPVFSPAGRLAFVSDIDERVPNGVRGVPQLYVAAPFGADLRITVDTVRTGNDLSFTVVATNDGPDPATATDMFMNFANNAVLVGHASTTVGGCSPVGGLLFRCPVGDLAAGASVTMTVRAAILVPAGTPVAIQTGAVTTNLDPVPANNNAAIDLIA
jgi:Tol biopolymer transport system component